MNSSVQRLQDTSIAMRKALSIRDWSAIGALDLQCRQAVDDAMIDSPHDEEMLRARIQELLDLYRELVVACQNERENLAGQLLQLNQSQKGAKVYQLFG